MFPRGDNFRVCERKKINKFHSVQSDIAKLFYRFSATTTTPMRLERKGRSTPWVHILAVICVKLEGCIFSSSLQDCIP